MKKLAVFIAMILLSPVWAAEEPPHDPDEILRQHEREAQEVQKPSNAERIKAKLAQIDEERAVLERQLQAAHAAEERERQFRMLHRSAADRIQGAQHELSDFENTHDLTSVYSAGLKKHIESQMDFDQKILGIKNIKQLDKMFVLLRQREQAEQEWRLVKTFKLQWQDRLRNLELGVKDDPDLKAALKSVSDQVALINKHNAQHFEDRMQLERERAVLGRRYDALRQSMESKEKK